MRIALLEIKSGALLYRVGFKEGRGEGESRPLGKVNRSYYPQRVIGLPGYRKGVRAGAPV